MKRNRKIMSALLAMTVFATSVFATPMDAQAASMKLNKTKQRQPLKLERALL